METVQVKINRFVYIFFYIIIIFFFFIINLFLFIFIYFNFLIFIFFAAQYRAIKTKYYRSKILKDGADPMCRICGQFQETIDHILAGYPELAKTEYLHSHNKAATYNSTETSIKKLI